MSELKPCPFCGATTAEVNTYHGGGYTAWVACRSCRVSGAVRDTVSEATKAWNHRPLEDALAAALEGLVEHGTPGTRVAAKDALAKVRGMEART